MRIISVINVTMAVSVEHEEGISPCVTGVSDPDLSVEDDDSGSTVVETCIVSQYVAATHELKEEQE